MKDMETLAERLRSPTVKAAADPTILADCEAQLHLRRKDGILTGRAIIRRKVNWAPWSFNQPPDGLTDGDFATLQTRLAGAYLHATAARRSEEARQLLQTYFDLCDHLLDQGWAEGNPVPVGIPDSASVYALRKELGETGRLRDLLLAAATHDCNVGDGFTVENIMENSPSFNVNCDMIWGTGLHTKALALLVLLPDPSERLQWTRAWQRLVNELCIPRYGEFIALDGTAHHHGMFHAAYGAGGLDRMILFAASPMYGTSFALSPESLAAPETCHSHLRFSLLGDDPAGECSGATLGGRLGSAYQEMDRTVGALRFGGRPAGDRPGNGPALPDGHYSLERPRGARRGGGVPTSGSSPPA